MGSRPLYQRGIEILKIISVLLFSVVVLSGLLIWLGISVVVTNRLLNMSKEIKNFPPNHQHGQQVTDQGEDEIGYLSKTINIFLRELKIAYEKIEIERVKATHVSKLASLGEMSASIAHEINNPLGIISGNLVILDRFREQPEKFLQKIEAMKKASMRVEKIVRGLKRFARTTDGTDRKVSAVEDILREALFITEAKSKRSGVEIQVDLEDQLYIFADEVEIEQVLINLINNAVDAIKNLPEKWIRVEGRLINGEVSICVIDSGSGIAPELEEKLFLPFFTTKTVGEGTGLGLSIIKGILDHHSGSIQIKRGLPNTCFEVRIKSYVQIESQEVPVKIAA